MVFLTARSPLHISCNVFIFLCMQIPLSVSFFTTDDPYRRSGYLYKTPEFLLCPRANGLFPFDKDCTKFINCAFGKPHLQACGPGTAFNPKISVCDHLRNVDCSKKNSEVHKTSQHAANLPQVEAPYKPLSQHQQVNKYAKTQPPFYGYFDPISQSKEGYGQENIDDDDDDDYHPSQTHDGQNKAPPIQSPERDNNFSQEETIQLHCPRPNGLFRYEKSCYVFINCTYGKPSLQQCGPGKMFNPKYSVCDYSRFSDCVKITIGDLDKNNGVTEMPIPESKIYRQKSKTIMNNFGHITTTIRPKETTKKQYVKADTLHGRLDQNRAPKSQVPQKEQMSCPQPNGLFPFEEDCSKFINCAFGTPFLQPCGPGTVFNPKISACDYPRNVDCGKKPGIKTTPPKSQQREHKVTTPKPTVKQTELDNKPKNRHHYGKDLFPVDSNGQTSENEFPEIDTKMIEIGKGIVPAGYDDQIERYPQPQGQSRTPNAKRNESRNVVTKKPSYWNKINQRISTYGTTLKDALSGAKGFAVERTTASVSKVVDKVKKTKDPLSGTKSDLKSDQPQNLCLKPDGQFPYPKNCAKFVNCWKGRGTVQNCAPGTLFDPSLGVCNWPNLVICSPQTADAQGAVSQLEASPPFSGQLFRLRNGGAPYIGYLEIWSANDWRPVVIEGDTWNGKDGACVRLGFNRGAHSESRGYIFGGKDKLGRVQETAVCDSNNVTFLDCPIKLLKKEDIILSAVGLRCRRNTVSECPSGWLRWGKKCYRAEPSEMINHAGAREKCESEGARLLSITSQEESNFVTDLLSSVSSNPNTGFHTGGVSLYTHGSNYWIWENTKIPPASQLSFTKWWLGWKTSPVKFPVVKNPELPEDSEALPLCISLHKTFPFYQDEKQLEQSAQYFYWELSDCTDKLGYVCEQDPLDIGCIVGRGETYNGTASVTTSGASCLPWKENPGAFRGFSKIRQLRGNFCLNPDGDDLPWCYVEGGTTEFCDIPRCQTSETRSNYSATTSACGSDTFTCSGGECIHLEWVCDGQVDCKNGKDEKGCPDYSNQFTKVSGKKLIGSETEKWVFSPKTTCASRCVRAKNFICHSFNYEESTSTCVLNKNNAGSSGGLANASNWEYHERSEMAPDCSQSFVCSDFQCFEKEMVCDGRRDCNGGEDENDCLDLDALEVRLVNGSGPHEGRVEIKVEDEWGQVCDDMWGLQDGDVVCRQLGYSKGAKETFTNSRFGNGGGNFLMDDLNCKGTEGSLALCDFAGWNKNDCTKTEAAGVQCYLDSEKCSASQWQCKNGRCIGFSYYCDQIDDCGDGSDEYPDQCSSPVAVRVVNAKSSDSLYYQPKSHGGKALADKVEGRVEIRFKGLWGTVCDDNIEVKEGHVLCRMAGYKGASAVHKNNSFGAGNGPVWVDGLECQGKENVITECKHQQWGRSNCDHTEDLGVSCTNDLPSSIGKSLQAETSTKTPNVNELFKTKCGVRYVEDSPHEVLATPRIVSGYFPRPGAHPWMVGIRRRTGAGTVHECGASILSEDLILTAAHCIFKYPISEYVVRTGDYNNEERDVYEQEWRVEIIAIHPEFDKHVLFNNDVALLKIKRKDGKGITFSERVQPICLVRPNWEYVAGLNCTVAGWGTMGSNSGYSRILQSTLLPIIPKDVCRAEHAYGSTRISKGMFCAGYMEGGIDTCQGDSGGSLVCYIDGMYTAVGITSWGHGCARANKPGVYTKLTQYLNWIYNTSLAIQKPKQT